MIQPVIKETPSPLEYVALWAIVFAEGKSKAFMNMTSYSKQMEQNLEVVRLLRCRKTNRYFAAEGWTNDAESAKLFEEEIDAVRDCLTHNLENIELVLRVRGGSADLFCTVLR